MKLKVLEDEETFIMLILVIRKVCNSFRNLLTQP